MTVEDRKRRMAKAAVAEHQFVRAWGSVDIRFRQALAPSFLKAWREAEGRHARDGASSRR